MKVTKEVIGGIQPVMVWGRSATDDAKTIVRQGVFAVARGEELNPAKVLSSSLARGIKDPKVVDIDALYYMQIKRTDYGPEDPADPSFIELGNKEYQAVEGELPDKHIELGNKEYKAVEGSLTEKN